MVAAYSVCKYFQFGHCRFGNLCRKTHVKQVCEKINCEIDNCTQRHPKVCKFFREYGRCKFGKFCNYSHLNGKIAVEEKRAMLSMSQKIAALENSNNDLTEKMKILETKSVAIKKKQKTFEKNLNEIETAVFESVATIITLKRRKRMMGPRTEM